MSLVSAQPLSTSQKLLSLDLRSLALFRVLLAVLLILDLCFRAVYLRDHYTDFGVLPRADLLTEFPNRFYFSLHMIHGSTLFQVILFVLAGVVALMLLVGYRTRTALILSWIFLSSVQVRNEMITDGGDGILMVFLFWAIFLPLGANYSIDSCSRAPAKRILPEGICTAATAAFILQICFVYWFTSILKTDVVWREEGTAVYYALSVDAFAMPLARMLREYPKKKNHQDTITAISYHLISYLNGGKENPAKYKRGSCAISN